MNKLWLVASTLVVVLLCTASAAETVEGFRDRSPWNDKSFFPIAVWLQSPANATRYREAGVNTYVGLWKGPTEDQIDTLKKAGLRLICHQNEVALRHRDDQMILGWMHDDEPDNAQSLGEGKGYGPPVKPDVIVEGYNKIRQRDPLRPVLLNLGQGVAWDGWYGRGTRTGHPEDYPAYIQGCDIVSFDIYPAVHDRPEISGNLWYVARGVERLAGWVKERQLVWNCLECTRIGNANRKPTPREVRAEAWMSLIHGSRGLIYFVHQFAPTFREAALLDDAEMLEAVTGLNHEISRLAPVLHSPRESSVVEVRSINPEVPVASLVKNYEGARYIFAVAMRPGETTAEFRVGAGEHTVEVLGEGRQLQTSEGSFTDRFADWAVHLYRLGPQK